MILLFGTLISASTFINPQTVLAQSSGNEQITVQSIKGESLPEIVIKKTKDSGIWFLVRASGLIAAGSLIILILSGIGSVTGHSFKFLDPITTWATHRALGIAFVISTFVHVIGLLFDKYVHFSVIDILVPFWSSYKPTELFGINVGSLYVTLGILAFYGSIIILVTSLKWIDKQPKKWKMIHILSYFVIASVFVHGLTIGTDLQAGKLRALWVVIGIILIIAIIARLRRTKTL